MNVSFGFFSPSNLKKEYKLIHLSPQKNQELTSINNLVMQQDDTHAHLAPSFVAHVFHTYWQMSEMTNTRI